MKYFSISLLIFALIFVSCVPAKYANLDDGLYANIETNKGEILLNLEFEKTPLTVANFVSLADGTNDFVTDSLKGKPFYNGIVFHRVISDFMIQGGDPTGTGNGSPGYKFTDEFPKDSLGNLLLKHSGPGILSMANSGPATNGSQFFITHNEQNRLNGKHTVFGNVVTGQKIVDSIIQNDTINNVEIVKIGKKARSFDASEVFSELFGETLKAKQKEADMIKNASVNTLEMFNENKKSAIELPSGLKYVITETRNDVFPKKGQKVKVNYAGYFSDGKLFDTSYEHIAKNYGVFDEKRASQGGYKPFSTVYGPDARLIAGFKEGMMEMKVGDKALLFIPSHLGYGPQGAGEVIPPNSDLVFEIEIVEIE